MQLKGGAGYMRDEPYEKVLRDIRIFPIFEGANDVMRAFIALSGMKPVGEKLSELGEIGLGDPIGSIGVLADYVGGRIQREVRPDRITMAHPELKRPRRAGLRPGQAAARRHRVAAARAPQGDHGAPVPAEADLPTRSRDIYAQIAVLSRVTQIFEDQGVEPSGQERYIAETFCTRAADRVERRFDQIEYNDDERMSAIAKLAYKRGEYGYALFED